MYGFCDFSNAISAYWDRNLTLFVFCHFFKAELLHGTGENTDGTNTSAMEPMEGALDAYLERNSSMSVFECLLLMRDAALAVDSLHSLPTPIIHGNLTPQGCLIEKQGVLKIEEVGSSHSHHAKHANDASLLPSLSTSQSVCDTFHAFSTIRLRCSNADGTEF